MDKALLDTDILSEVLKARDKAVVAQATAYKSSFDRFTISVITVMEIVKGLHKKGRTDALDRFLQGIKMSEVVVFDEASAEVAGRMYGDLERTGQTIGRADVMIASLALNHGLTLVTGNVRHYQRIQHLGYDLKLDNWRDTVLH